MLTDLLSESNMFSYNIKVAHKFGLHAAIYLQELININDKAIRKNATKYEGKYFTVKRDYIKYRTTLEIEEQLRLDKLLSQLEILKTDIADSNTMSLDLNTLVTLITDEDIKLNKGITKIVSLNSKRDTKKKAVHDALCDRIITQNMELRQAYINWIESMLNAGKKMTSAVVDQAQQFVDTVTNHDLDMALGIVNKATLHNYCDMSWAYERYQKDYRINTRKNIDTTGVVSVEVDKDEGFF